ncbi:hypothetical protein CR513_17481, partial [Mucuna pruriens]
MDSLDIWKFILHLKINTRLPSLSHLVPFRTQACRITIAYHPQKNDQGEDALWAHQTAYRTLLEMSPHRIVFGKARHLPVEIEH